MIIKRSTAHPLGKIWEIGYFVSLYITGRMNNVLLDSKVLSIYFVGSNYYFLIQCLFGPE